MTWRQLTHGKGRRDDQGYLLVLVIVSSVVLLIIATALVSVLAAKYSKTGADGDTSKAVYAAEAGVTDTLARLSHSSSFGGYTTKKQFYSATDKGKAEYTTAVAAGTGNTLIVTSTGYYTKLTSGTDPSATRTIKVVLTRSKTAMSENILAGPGGLTVSGAYAPWVGGLNAVQKGSIYVRGKVHLNGTGTSIGTATESSRLVTPNVGCGTAANFPQPCASSDPPITFGGVGYFGGQGMIYGSVCATDQPLSAQIQPGPTGTGLETCVAPDYGAVKFDKKKFTNTKTLNVSATASQCNANISDQTIPSLTWAKNSRITGDVTLEGNFYDDCRVTIMGDIYIKGNLTIGSRARLMVDNSLGTKKPTIVVNGSVIIKESAAGVFANDDDTPVNIVSFWSHNNTCSTNDECSELTSEELYNSTLGASTHWLIQGMNRAIYFENSAGVGPADISGLTTYSYFGSTMYTFEGNRSMRGIGGQEVIINPGGVLNYSGGGLAITDSTPFSELVYRDSYGIGDYIQMY